MGKLLNDIEKYWTNRAEGYSQININQLHSERKLMWKNALQKVFPQGNPSDIKVLDIGTGPGFFSIILAELGYDVTAVDYTEAMLAKAKANARELQAKIKFKRMDAQNLDFADNIFDVIVTRNLTWVLENPTKAYNEWYRVLKKGGMLLNFDANWYMHLFDMEKRKAYESDRFQVSKNQLNDHYTSTDVNEMERIAKEMPLSPIKRPEWDIKVLTKKGFDSVKVDENIWQHVWNHEEKINYASTPMFLIQAYK